MQVQQFNTIRNTALLVVIIYQLAYLTWEYMNGGIVTHHLLMRADLPGISNLWGLIILPALVWLTSISIKKRAEATILSDKKNHSYHVNNNFYRNILIGFAAMFTISLTQSIFFSLGYSDVAKYALLAMMIGALFFPLHRLEYVLGFVLAGSFFTGPAIPFIGVFLFSTVSILVHLCIKPLFKKVVNGEKANAY